MTGWPSRPGRGSCSLPDCDRPAYARDVCERHYKLLRSEGALTKLPESTTYGAVHTRLRKQRGVARNHSCVVAGCERPASSWTWDRTGPSITGPDSVGVIVSWGTDLATYYPMCPSHASMMDRGGTLTHCPNGHDRSEVGTNSQGKCRECQRERDRTRERNRRRTQLPSR